SAMTMVEIAAHSVAWARTSAESLSSITSLMPIHSNNAPPASLRYGTPSSRPITAQNATRNRTAPRLPKKMARRRMRSGRLREAMAITTALSPDSTTLESTILPTAAQKAADHSSITVKSPTISSIMGIRPNRPSSSSTASICDVSLVVRAVGLFGPVRGVRPVGARGVALGELQAEQHHHRRAECRDNRLGLGQERIEPGCGAAGLHDL